MLKYLGVKNIDTKLDYVFNNEDFKIYCKNENSKQVALSTLDYILKNNFYNKNEIRKVLFRENSQKIIYFYNIKGNDCEDVMAILNANKRISNNYKIYMALYFTQEDNLYNIYENKYIDIFDFIQSNNKVDVSINFCECKNNEEKGLRIFITI